MAGGPASAPHDPAGLRRVRARALTIGVSVMPFALSYGAVSVSTGLSVLQTCLLSLVLFSGASQFAFVSIFGGGGGLASAVGTALLLGVRNALYAARVASLIRPRGWRRAVAAQTTIDESTAMAVAEESTGLAGPAFWMTAGAVFVLWNAGTAIGALAGSGLGSPAAAGLDAAGPAAFVALLAPRLANAGSRTVAVVAALVAVLAVPVLPLGVPILAGTAAALALTVRRGA
jgi:predicted branched-subunit amino acid permease